MSREPFAGTATSQRSKNRTLASRNLVIKERYENHTKHYVESQHIENNTIISNCSEVMLRTIPEYLNLSG